MDLSLSQNELGILIEALDSWVCKEDAGHIMMDVIDMTISKDPDKSNESINERNIKMKRSKMIREETATLIKAKLIQAKQELTAEELTKVKR